MGIACSLPVFYFIIFNLINDINEKVNIVIKTLNISFKKISDNLFIRISSIFYTTIIIFI